MADGLYYAPHDDCHRAVHRVDGNRAMSAPGSALANSRAEKAQPNSIQTRPHPAVAKCIALHGSAANSAPLPHPSFVAVRTC